MFNWNWVLANKENITWVCVSIGGVYAFFIWTYKKVYKPLHHFIERVKKGLAELEYNGGGSMKDMARSNQTSLNTISKDVSLIKATQAANIRLNPDCIFQCDGHGKCIMVNESLCRLFGGTKDQLLGFGWVNFIAENERERAREAWESAVKNDNEINADYTIVSNGREPFKCTYTAYIDRNHNTNEIISIFGIVNKKN